MFNDKYWMRQALILAQQAELHGEVPVGALIVLQDELIGSGWNQPISQQDPTAHAEIVALREACAHQQNYRLPGSTMYITLEPCIMCAGAIVHARIERVVFAATEPKTGAAGSCMNIFNTSQLNHRVQYENGVLAEESSKLLRDFFRAKR
ncbi:tRNA adenosine(34) deaminase TadA [Methylophaga nitratireducenticrescens]|uniref:tRNA-specific adenosine deaminase n=1 Tax=Methylophaga nitratireducenticrescens TaxID=754476 RepID=I1XGS4_METNJ|nr:tRNA adenosine(34) deaminase TadA [Methylophaga nitratireducenticrescens]AFI83593.1 tRNA-specific adenosine deaminase [Methylophaga nitratireducenticrescens]AUZ83651.1 tRNA-specific adenosine deaminase [Methylophaga nitratireducenticrescens]